MKYSTQILLFVFFLVVGFTGYLTYQIFMNEQDIVQSNIVFSINNTALSRTSSLKLPITNFAVLSEEDIVKLINDKIFKPSILLEKIYLAEVNTNKGNPVLAGWSSWNGWNGLLSKVFGLYMDWLGKGSKMQKFSAQTIKDFSPYYDIKKCDLSKVVYGYAPRLAKKLNSPHLGITDGYKIMYGDEDYVKTFSAVNKITDLSDGEVYWMAHELTHCEQYAGNRDKYAVRWFNELFDYASAGFVSDFWKAIKKAIWTMDFDPVITVLTPENLAKYDDNMPLEKEAYEKGMKVVGEVSKIRAQEQTKIEFKPSLFNTTTIKTLVPVKITP
ncbi:MAG TPA: hypothetical protein P5230_02150 [Candidatus Magasanikbacteria bacterium]|nr:hypothetical protein [Candidatus Magasanikbacteria bacterium]